MRKVNCKRGDNYTHIRSIFENANLKFLASEKHFISSNVSERSLCGSLQKFIGNEITKTPYKKYYVDIEYNRNQGKVKTIINNEFEVVTVNSDLIVHSKGEIIKQDNLLALEMKKSNRPLTEKNKDRLIALTKSSYDGVYSNDGIALPEHVCGYILGIYYEINIRKNTVQIEYYCNRKLYKKYDLQF